MVAMSSSDRRTVKMNRAPHKICFMSGRAYAYTFTWIHNAFCVMLYLEITLVISYLVVI